MTVNVHEQLYREHMSKLGDMLSSWCEKCSDTKSAQVKDAW